MAHLLVYHSSRASVVAALAEHSKLISQLRESAPDLRGGAQPHHGQHSHTQKMGMRSKQEDTHTHALEGQLFSLNWCCDLCRKCAFHSSHCCPSLWFSQGDKPQGRKLDVETRRAARFQQLKTDRPSQLTSKVGSHLSAHTHTHTHTKPDRKLAPNRCYLIRPQI